MPTSCITQYDIIRKTYFVIIKRKWLSFLNRRWRLLDTSLHLVKPKQHGILHS